MQNWEAAVNKKGRTIYKTPFILKDNTEFSDYTPFHFWMWPTLFSHKTLKNVLQRALKKKKIGQVLQ